MSIVWLVEDSSGNSFAAKEPIVQGVSQEEAVRNIKFVEHEGRILSMISHTNVCGFYGAYRSKYSGLNSVMIVIEYMDGGSLRDIPQPLPPEELKDVLRQMLEGLAAVHSAGIIHRDIKPSNVMRSRGLVKLIDFGTALLRFESAREVVVSPGGYTAPEQLRGTSLFQSDIWSVGATVLYLATKKSPCQFMRGYDCSSSPRAPGALELALPDLGSELLNRFVAKALNPDYSQRFADAVDALMFLEGRHVERRGLRLIIKGKTIDVASGRIYIGRGDERKLDLVLEGEVLYIYDPERYISRRHVEIAEIHGRWYIRDLGSTNRTAIYRGGSWFYVWRGKGVTSQWFELKDGDILALGYDDKKGPYILVTVKL